MADRIGLRAPAVQQAGDARYAGMDGQPGAAGLLVEPAEQRRAGPVPRGRQPRPVGQLVTGPEQQQRNPVPRFKAQDYGAHVSIMTRWVRRSRAPRPAGPVTAGYGISRAGGAS